MEAHVYNPVPAFKTLADIAGKNVTVMGLGLNGGGLATAAFLLAKGARVTVTDLKSEADLSPSVEELREKAREFGAENRLRFVLGVHELADFASADVVIKNPGVKFEGNRFLAAAKAIETDLSLFLRFCPSPIIAVTGSKGKSSTASAIHYGLDKAGFKTFLGGNITVSPLTFLERTAKDTPVVLELSSWQLADLRGRGVLKPAIAVLTKIVPDHQNWYGNMESYVADKKLIYADQDAGCYTICETDGWGDVFAAETHARVLRSAALPPLLPDGTLDPSFTGAWLDEKNCGWSRLDAAAESLFILGALAVPGFHQRQNLLKAALVMRIMGVSPSKTAAILAGYPGIQHRLEYFHTWQLPPAADGSKGSGTGSEKTGPDGDPSVLFYNDSAATVPEAAAAALGAFEKPIHLICGGTDKNLLFEPLAAEIGRAKSIYVLAGTGTDKLLPMLKARSLAFYGPFASLESLLRELRGNLAGAAGGNEIVVFSPGATSFGMFKNEFDRGATFKELVKKIF